MGRMERLKEYARNRHTWNGAARDQKNLDRWSERASANSEIAPRASEELKLPSTGKAIELRDTSMGPKVSRAVNSAMKGAK